MNYKIDEPVWCIETFGNSFPNIWLGKLIDIQKDKAIVLIGYQDYMGTYEDVVWGMPLRDIFSFGDYEQAKMKLLIYDEEYKNKVSIKANLDNKKEE